MILFATSHLEKQSDITKKKNLERTQRHKEEEGTAVETAVSSLTGNLVLPYSRATPILNEC